VSAPQAAANPLVELVKARLREFLREPGYVFWVFGFPLLMAIGLGLAFRERAPDRPRVALVGELQGELFAALSASPRVSVERMSPDQGRRSLGRAKLDLVIEPAGNDIVLRFDATQERGVLARALVGDVLERAAGRVERLNFREVTVSELGSRYVDFLMPGLIGLNLMGSSMWGIGFNLVLARKRRLLRRYAVTPMRRSHFLLSYFFSRSIFLVLELLVLVAFGHFVFETVIRGSISAFIVAAGLGAAAFAAISLIIGARLASTEVANGWMNFVQLPMWLLSGAFFSYERFPEWLTLPIRLLPLTAVNDALRAVYNDGAGLADLGFELGVLSAWTLLGFGIALRTFRWQ
jgi:ABC-type multidrug transport system permease subunit